MSLELDHVTGEHDDREEPGCSMCDRSREELAGRRIVAALVMVALTAALFLLATVLL